jgi:hypothetical protein
LSAVGWHRNALYICARWFLSGGCPIARANFAKVGVEGSNPFARSTFFLRKSATWTGPSGSLFASPPWPAAQGKHGGSCGKQVVEGARPPLAWARPRISGCCSEQTREPPISLDRLFDETECVRILDQCSHLGSIKPRGNLSLDLERELHLAARQHR